MRLEIIAAAHLSDKEMEELEALHTAVYPPRPRANGMVTARVGAPAMAYHDSRCEWSTYFPCRRYHATMLVRPGGDPDWRNRRCNDAPVAARQRLRWRRDKTGDRIPAARQAGRHDTALLRPAIAELLSAFWLQEFRCRYLCTAERRKDNVSPQRDHGDARPETRAAMRGAGFMRPSLVIAAALNLQPGT